MGKVETKIMDDRAFRNIVGNFCTGVTVITTKNDQFQPIGFTANSFTSLSLDPKLVLFNIDKKSGSFTEFTNAKHFAVNILSDKQIDLSKQFSKSGIDRFRGVDYYEDVTGSPILHGSLAYLDCKVRDLYEGGDHIIVTGEVLSANTQPGSPLIFFQGKYLET